MGGFDALVDRISVRQIEIVVITGVSTNVAVAGCSMVAADLGYHVVIPEDCVAASAPVTHTPRSLGSNCA
jgi:Amidases related to nicotinamidase